MKTGIKGPRGIRGRSQKEKSRQEVMASNPKCSFCHVHARDNVVRWLISGPETIRPRAYICNRCVAYCVREILQQDSRKIEATVKKIDGGRA